MPAKISPSLRLLAFVFCFLSMLSAGSALTAQSPEPSAGVRATPDRLVRPIDENVRVKLAGTVHPLATKANDRGAISDGQKLDRLQIVLKRSDAQESELKQLIGDMHTPGSANYHKWLTPDDFGKRFGPSDADVAKVEGWLSSHGFSITKLNPGRQTLEVSGSAGQFRDTFHAAIHSYQVKGQTHFANATVPEIPEALAPVFGGFASLNNFPVKSYSHNLGKASYDTATHESEPEWTRGNSSGVNYVISPADFAVQYDLKPLYTAGTNGAGQSIAIVNEANINIAQVNNFRTLFGLPANNPPQIVIDGNDPGIDGINSPYGPNYATFEAYLDVEWAGAVAPNAQINLVIAASTAVEDGLALAAQRAVYSNISPVLSLSFGNCEATLGSNNAFWSGLWQQAAAQGITVVVSSGDSGSAACDDDNTQSFAYGGQAVNGIASTPYNVAVGGTDFYYSNYAGASSALNAQIATFWNGTPSNATPSVSLLQHVPEQPWNGSQFGLNALPYEQTIAGGGGGASNCALGTADARGNYTACTGGNPKPLWQTGTGVPADGVRDIPDVSLFASLDSNFSYFPLCADDGDCQPGTSSVQISGVGGTSESAPSFAGIMALVNQKYGRQGQANYVLYPLAAQHPAAFYDVANGSNAVPCNLQTVQNQNDGTTIAPADCIAGTPAVTIQDDTYGSVAEGEIGLSNTPAYNAGPGYDLASGLGTIDANVMVSNWNSVAFASSTTTLTPSATTFAHGTSITLSGAVAPPAGGATPTGSVALLTDSIEPSQQGHSSFALANGAFSGSYNALPGGTYNIWGYYGGDGVTGASTSAKTLVTVAPENSTTGLTIYSSLSTNTGNPLPASGGVVTYGQPTVVRAIAAGVNSTGNSTSPTGSVVISDGSAAVNTAVLNTEGDAEYSHAFAVGSHSITAKYSGDNSYNASTSSAINFTVSKDTPDIYYNITNQTTDNNGNTVVIGNQATILTVVVENHTAVAPGATAPTGTLTLTGAPSGNGTATLGAAIDASTGAPDGVATFTIPAGTSGTYTLNLAYNGDSNYTAQTASISGQPFQTYTGASTSTITASAAANQTSPTAKILVNTVVTGTPGGPAPTGSIFLVSSGVSLGTVSLPTSSTNSVTLTLAFDSQNLFQGLNQITLQYSGDNTYFPSSTSVNITNSLSDFQMVPLTTIVNAPSATPATDTINLTSTNSFAGTVSLTCAGAAGITCSLSPAAAVLSAGGSASSVLTINTSAVTATGTYNLVVTGKDSTGNFIHTNGLQVVVPTAAAPVPGFTLANSAAIAIAAPGQSGTSIVSATPTNGFVGDVALSCAVTSSPSGATGTPTCSLSPATASITGTTAAMSTLTVNTGATTTAGSYTVTVTGTSGSITQTASVPVTVAAGPGFAVTGTALASTTVGGTATSTISVTPSGGFTGNVALTCAVTGPSGATDAPTCSFASATETLSGTAAATTTLSVATLSTTSPGTYSVVVTGTSGTLTENTTLPLTVTAVPAAAFTLNTPTGITIGMQGGSGTSTITVTPTNGFTGDVALSCALTSSPSGASEVPTCSLSPTTATIPAGSTAAVSSTLTVNTTPQTTAGLAVPIRSLFATGGGIALAALLFFGFPAGPRGRRTRKALRTLRVLSLAAAFALLAGAGMGCGGGKSTSTGPVGGTTTGAYSFTVTATSGTVTQTATVAVTVN